MKTGGVKGTGRNGAIEPDNKNQEVCRLKEPMISVNSSREMGDEEDFNSDELAPDGGWGYIIALAMIVVYITINGPVASFAIIFGDFLEASGAAGSALTLFNSVFMITYSASGLMTNSLMKKYSVRSIGVTGALLYTVPNVAYALVNSVYEIAIICLIQGLGLGLIFTILNTTFNAYFVKKRSQVMSASQVIIGLGAIVYPIGIERLMNLYGFRGTAALTGAVSLNCIVAMTLMHPVEWHSKKSSEIPGEKIEVIGERPMSDRRSTIDVIRDSSKTKWSSLRSLKDDGGKDVPLLIEALMVSRGRIASASESDGLRDKFKSGAFREPLRKKLSTLSASSLANLVTGFGGVPSDIRQLQLDSKKWDKGQSEDCDTNDGWAWRDFVEMSLIKNRSFINICLGISFVQTSDYTFISLLPLMMTSSGFSQNDAALAITISAAAELVSRILLAIFTLLIDVKAKYLFFIAMICMGFAKVGFLVYEDSLTGCLTMVAVIGVVRSWLLVPQPLVIVEDLTVDKFASAYGIYAVISGIINIVFGPIVGLVKDWTNSFFICQLLLLGMSLLFVIPWGLQFFLIDLKNRDEKQQVSKHTIRRDTINNFQSS
ncbi:monocarboxylate transporter 7 [Prorops nasuta]|uniref:monocarboxylate transporter 7 n=1 Tax=Prorops nasuta TaxID=863751 RepID=UPI0034CD12A5